MGWPGAYVTSDFCAFDGVERQVFGEQIGGRPFSTAATSSL